MQAEHRSILRTTALALAIAAFTAGINPARAAQPVDRITGAGARVLNAGGAPLTLPSSASPAAIAAAFVRSQPDRADVQLRVAAEVPGRDGVTHLRMEQTVDGLRVHGAYARVAVSSRGEVTQLIDALVLPAGRVAQATVTPRGALEAALAELGYSAAATDAGQPDGNFTRFAVAGDFHRPPVVEQVVYADRSGLHEGFVVETWSARRNQLDYTLVSDNGAIVSVERRTNNDSYNVFVEDPGKGAQTPVNGPGAGNPESPSGWLAGTQTTVNIRGNNARAYLDADANNAPDSGGSAVPDGNFLATADLGQAPTTTGNKAVAVQNLFYLNNVAHDTLYRHGFDEAAGNFQVDNFGNGGLANDPVNAEAQDGSGVDNANFSTPNDGSSPRMQMYLWTGAAPNALVTLNGTEAGAYASSFGAALTTTGINGALAVYNDGSGDATDGCEASKSSLSGKIALVTRGTCNFTVKVYNAQVAGAVAVIISNNVDGNAFSPGGTDRKVKIPSAMVTRLDGVALTAQAGTQANLRKSAVTALQIDGDLDSDIVFHEYGHGLTWRMIGGMSGKLAGAIGEGASDVNAFLINGDDRIGEYAYSDALGIRRYPYAGYPLTYSNVTGAEVHNDGEIYAGAMWRVLENYLAAGLTAADLMDDFVDGMNYTPAGPAFENMRDGMLQSAAGSGRECLIWRGFAQSGIGVGAKGTVTKRGTLSITESFALPASCP